MTTKKEKILTEVQILKKRNKLKMSQYKFAIALGVTPTTVSRWENGISSPSPYNSMMIRKLKG